MAKHTAGPVPGGAARLPFAHVPGKRRILSTHAYTLSPAWLEQVDAIDRRTVSTVGLISRVIRSASDYDAVVLDGSVGWRAAYGDLVAASIIARRPKGPAVIITDCSWKLSDRWLDRVLCRLGVSAVDSPRVTYCVRSTEELKLLPSAWGIDPSRVVFTPYGHTLSAAEMALSEPDRSGVFAGGNALRDYATLVDAVRGLPTEVTIATSLPISVDKEPNVRVVPVTPHDRFIDLLRGAHVVVVPFQTGIRRASGLDTYLAAMALGQIVIVSRCPGTSDYIEDGRTGIVVPPGDVAALRRALEWCFDPANSADVEAIRDRARQAARERFSFVRHAETLLDVVDEAIAANTGRITLAGSRP